MIFFYVRHGDPTYDPDELTPLGHRQAEAVSRRLTKNGLDRIFSSTSTRAYQTAIPTAEILKKEITRLDFTNEKYAYQHFSVIDNDGKRKWIEASEKYREILISPEVYALGDRWYDHPAFAEFNFGEAIEDYKKKIFEFIGSLGYEHDSETRSYRAVDPNDERIALFAHGGFGNVFLSTLLDIPYPWFASHLGICHTGTSIITFGNKYESVIPMMRQFGGDSHLFAERLPTEY